MRTGIDFQGLLDVVKANANKTPLPFYLGTWCNTSACLIGNYHISNENANLRHEIFKEGIYFRHEDIAERFGISLNESRYLFHSNNPVKFQDGTTNYFVRNTKQCYVRDGLDKEAAINRLRKFIYYHLRKNEFCLDDNGVTEYSRECGDVRFDEQILELVH